MKRSNPLKYIYWPFLKFRAIGLSRLISPSIDSQATVLDVGAGNMVLAKILKQNKKVEIQGLDVIDMNLTDLPHQLFDGETFPYEDNSYDVVLLIGVLHHVEDQEAILKEAIRVARSKIIIFEDTYSNKVGRLWVKFRDIIGNLVEELHMNFALNFKTEKEWELVFDELGMRVTHKEKIFNKIRPTRHLFYVLDVESGN